MSKQIDGIKKFTREESKQSSKDRAPIVSFVSGKGGTGKSVLILSIAASLAASGKRVLLIDCDTTFANLSILCNYLPSITLADFFDNTAELEGITKELAPHLFFIPGSSGYRDYGEVTQYDLEKLFTSVSNTDGYDIVLIDTASGLQKQAVEILKNSAIAVLISGTEPTSLMDTYLVEKLIHQELLNLKRVVLINKASSDAAGKEAYENLNKPITHFLGNPIALLGIVLLSSEISDSVMKQHIAYSESAANSVFRKRIDEMGKELYEYVSNIKESV